MPTSSPMITNDVGLLGFPSELSHPAPLNASTMASTIVPRIFDHANPSFVAHWINFSTVHPSRLLGVAFARAFSAGDLRSSTSAIDAQGECCMGRVPRDNRYCHPSPAPPLKVRFRQEGKSSTVWKGAAASFPRKLAVSIQEFGPCRLPQNPIGHPYRCRGIGLEVEAAHFAVFVDVAAQFVCSRGVALLQSKRGLPPGTVSADTSDISRVHDETVTLLPYRSC